MRGESTGRFSLLERNEFMDYMKKYTVDIEIEKFKVGKSVVFRAKPQESISEHTETK